MLSLFFFQLLLSLLASLHFLLHTLHSLLMISALYSPSFLITSTRLLLLDTWGVLHSRRAGRCIRAGRKRTRQFDVIRVQYIKQLAESRCLPARNVVGNIGDLWPHSSGPLEPWDLGLTIRVRSVLTKPLLRGGAGDHINCACLMSVTYQLFTVTSS